MHLVLILNILPSSGHVTDFSKIAAHRMRRSTAGAAQLSPLAAQNCERKTVFRVYTVDFPCAKLGIHTVCFVKFVCLVHLVSFEFDCLN